MEIDCPSCRKPVAAGDVNPSTGLVRCRTCNNVFRFDTTPELAPAPARARPLAGRPQNVAMSESNGELTISYRWLTGKVIAMAVFCVLWMGFLAAWFGFSYATRSWIMVAVAGLLLGIGLGMTYSTLAGLLNTTTIRLDGSRMSVRHGPLPWPGNADYAIAEVQQLYCEEKVAHGPQGVSYTYNLGALLHDGRRRKVISGAHSPDLPLFLKQHAERWMRIADVPVAGELVG